MFYRPKIQRLVTPIRLQRRRHLRSLKRRRFERQKELKSEYDALIAKRVAEKKAKAAAAAALAAPAENADSKTQRTLQTRSQRAGLQVSLHPQSRLVCAACGPNELALTLLVPSCCI